jgi:ADP-heptose:LPS heptosyltransferase
MKVLIIRFSSIGDIVLTTPVIRCLKEQLGAEIHFYTKPTFASIVESNPYISKVHKLPDAKTPFLKTLKDENFDYIIDLHNNFRTHLLKLYLGKPSFSYDKLNWAKYLLVNFKINKMPNLHIVDRYINAAKPLGIKNDQKGLDYFIPQKDEVAIHTLPSIVSSGYTALVVGASYSTKRLPLHKLIELVKTIHEPILVLGGKEDSEVGNILKDQFPEKIFNGAGKFNLNQSASLVKQAKRVYSHDTGLMHIAAAFKKDILSIWGNTVPEFGMYPYQTSFSIIENQNLSCRPCSKIGYNKCPKGHFKCMNDLNFE